MPAPQVDAVDTVGAGDTLNGALGGGLAPQAWTSSRRHAAPWIAASLAVTKRGAREGMPTTAELEQAAT